MEEIFTLNGATALVTGGGRGIGLAIARSLAGAGARVLLVGREPEPLRKACEGIGPNAAAVPHDVSDLAAAPDFARRVIDAHGPVDLLVHNAGTHLKKPALETGEDEFSAMLRVHVLGAHALTRAFAPPMVGRGRGAILFITSMAAVFGIPNVAAYSAAKAAVAGLVRALAVELSPRGVRVNAIAPGWIETDMTRRAMEGDPGRRRRILERTPMGRFGTAEDVGHAAVYLCSPAARFVTGVVLPVDGGVSVGF